MDIFEIIVPKEELENLDIRPFETSWGITFESYVFLNNQPVAMVSQLENYHNQFELEINNCIVLVLNRLPENDIKIKYSSIQNIFMSLNKAVLIYEFDCDQNAFSHFNLSKTKLNDLLNHDLKPITHSNRAFTLRKE